MGFREQQDPTEGYLSQKGLGEAFQAASNEEELISVLGAKMGTELTKGACKRVEPIAEAQGFPQGAKPVVGSLRLWASSSGS